MGMQGIGGSVSSYAKIRALQSEAAEKAGPQAGAEASEPKRDRFEKQAQTKEAGIYEKPAPDKRDATVQQMMSEAQRQLESFRQLLQRMIVGQGQAANLSLFGMELQVTPEDSARAAASIAEGGAFSVDAVATRILDMAKALSGGDASKIELLRHAVEKGFEAAGVELGGELPDISQRTYDEVMRRFDAWEEESKPETPREDRPAPEAALAE